MTKLNSSKNKSVYVLNSTSSIRKKYYQLYQSSKTLVEKEKKGNTFLPTFSYLLCDIFCSLYEGHPELKQGEEIDPQYLINMTILEGFLLSDSYIEIRNKTCFSSITSIWATEMFAERLISYLSRLRWKKRIRKFTKKYLKDIISLNDEEEVDKNNKEKKKGSFLSRFFSPVLNKDKNNKKDKYIGKLKKKMSSVTLVSSKEVLQEIDNVKNVVEICQGWDIEQGIEELSYEEKMKLTVQLKNNPRLKEFAEIIGRLRQMSLTVRYSKIHEMPYEIYNIVMGDDLMKMHPLEITYLSHPSFQYDFYQRLAYKKLIQYELKGKEPESHGSIIACIDTSGSMSGKPEIMSKAVALGLLEIARVDDRNFIAIIFGQKGRVKSFAFKKNEIEIEIPDKKKDVLNFSAGLIEFIVGFIGGGTDFETPINTALAFLEKETVYKDADIVFITDDICNISESFLKTYYDFKRKKNFRTYGVLIGPKSQEPATLKRFCDEVMNYHIFTEHMAENLFRKISSKENKN
ncbi:hypothetical protein HY745_05970 [Candidatus Desantisbacteria bacterium]|nr:hypothetical protein [Candidatus Desantisbacteria bacterium]